jgi:ATP-dependent Zn protease
MARQGRNLTMRAAEATAYHEAGHAVFVWRLMARKPTSATIVPDQDSHGQVLHPSPLKGIRLDIDNTGPRAESRARQAIMICLAGAIAQRRFAPRSIRRWHPHEDYWQASAIAKRMCGSEKEMNSFLRWLQVRSENLVDVVWQEIVAKALLARHSLNGEEILTAISSVQPMDPPAVANSRDWKIVGTA